MQHLNCSSKTQNNHIHIYSYYDIMLLSNRMRFKGLQLEIS